MLPGKPVANMASTMGTIGTASPGSCGATGIVVEEILVEVVVTNVGVVAITPVLVFGGLF
jgi:hypothetical protein